MNLAQVIHQRWAADSTLNGLLPATRVYTGLSFDPTRPFAVISKESDKPETYHSDGSAIDAVGLRIQVFHDNYDAGAEIAHQIKKVFDRTAFDLSGSDKVLNIQRGNNSENQTDDGVWQFIMDFICTVYLASGV
ncbi:MAG: DUF3168 domain-containing protein [Thermoguttaceae bacterium]|jgi:hypothetical protein